MGFWVGSCAMWVTTVWTMGGYFSGSPCAPLGMQAAMATTSGVVPRKAGGVDFEAATDMTSDGVALVPSVPSPQVRISAPSRIDLHTARRGTHRPSRQATGDARRWLAEHGEQGFRYPGDRTEEILEEQLAKAFRQHVVDLMLEYARFDEERRFYCDRAVAIANGSLPEDKDIPFYAACLNGCIEVIPLGYADYQGTSVIGAGPLRISIGSCQASGQDGASTGHFVLLQSWLPLQTELRQCGAFPFGVCAAARCVAESANVAARGSTGEPATAAARVLGQLGDVEQEARPSPPPTSDQREDSDGQASLARLDP